MRSRIGGCSSGVVSGVVGSPFTFGASSAAEFVACLLVGPERTTSPRQPPAICGTSEVRTQEEAAKAKAKAKAEATQTAARLRLANQTLAKIQQPLAALEDLIANAGWDRVPEVIRGPAEDIVRTLHRAVTASNSVVARGGAGELQIADSKASSSQSVDVLAPLPIVKTHPRPSTHTMVPGLLRCPCSHNCKGPMLVPQSICAKTHPTKALGAIVAAAKKSHMLAKQVLDLCKA